jgi:hypothetical protein
MASTPAALSVSHNDFNRKYHSVMGAVRSLKYGDVLQSGATRSGKGGGNSGGNYNSGGDSDGDIDGVESGNGTDSTDITGSGYDNGYGNRYGNSYGNGYGKGGSAHRNAAASGNGAIPSYTEFTSGSNKISSTMSPSKPSPGISKPSAMRQLEMLLQSESSGNGRFDGGFNGDSNGGSNGFSGNVSADTIRAYLLGPARGAFEHALQTTRETVGYNF